MSSDVVCLSNVRLELFLLERFACFIDVVFSLYLVSDTSQTKLSNSLDVNNSIDNGSKYTLIISPSEWHEPFLELLLTIKLSHQLFDSGCGLTYRFLQRGEGAAVHFRLQVVEANQGEPHRIKLLTPSKLGFRVQHSASYLRFVPSQPLKAKTKLNHATIDLKSCADNFNLWVPVYQGLNRNEA